MEVVQHKTINVTVEISPGELIQGIAEIHGFLELREDGLFFGYRTKSLLNNFSSQEDVLIPFNSISVVEYKRGLVAPKIIVRPRHLGIMDQIPGESRSHMIFKIKWGDKSYAESFVSLLKYNVLQEEHPHVDSIPFQMASTSMGLQEHSGLIYLDEEFLVFDLQSGFSGLPKEERHQVKIEPTAIQQMRMEPGVINDTLFVRPKKDALLEAMPGSHAGELKLTVKKKYREQLERLIALVSHA